MASASKTIGGITFTVSKAGSGGSTLTTDWYKVLVQCPNYAHLVGDGLIVLDGMPDAWRTVLEDARSPMIRAMAFEEIA